MNLLVCLTKPKMSSRSILSLFVTALMWITPIGEAGSQDTYTVRQDQLIGITSSIDSQEFPATRISLDLKDSTVEFAINSIAQQAALRPVLNTGDPVLMRRINVEMKDVSVAEALARVLDKTGLAAKLAADGKTLMVRPAGDGEKGRVRPTTPEKGGGVTGKVIDSASGEAVEGVVAQIGALSKIVVTDKNGVFVFRDLEQGTHLLTFKLLGFRTQSRNVEVKTGGQVSIEIRMVPTANVLSEIVTTATGQHRKYELGSDIVKINPTEILERAPARTVTDLIRYAQVPGVHVVASSGEPGAPSRIRMRGISSISQNTDPAIIVDGIWISSDMSSDMIANQAMVGANSEIKSRYTPSGLDDIDPEMIESIELVRGPSAATLYGQEAANGVIVITTKKGKAGQTSWSFSYSRDWDDQPRAQFGNWLGFGTRSAWWGLREDVHCTIEQHIGSYCRQDSAVNLHATHGLLDHTASAVNRKYNVGVMGGNSQISYSFMAGIVNNLGTDRMRTVDRIRLRLLNIDAPQSMIRPTMQDRRNLNGSITFNPNPGLNFQISLNVSDDDIRQNGFRSDHSTYVVDPRDTLMFLSQIGDRSVSMLYGGTSALSTQGGIQGSYDRNTWWRVRAQMGVDHTNRTDHAQREDRVCNMSSCNPDSTGLEKVLINSTIYTSRLVFEGTPRYRYDKIISVIPSIGMDIRQSSGSNTGVRLITPHGSANYSGTGAGALSNHKVVTAGYFANANLRMLGRLYFDIGLRHDIGSVIRVSSKNTFPRLSTSWLLSNEDFFPKYSWLDILRLRVAYGHAAVHPTEADLYGNYVYNRATLNGSDVVIAQIRSIGNNKLLPERSSEIEGGIDLDLLDSRMTLALNIAHKRTGNAIITAALPPSSGAVSPMSRRENIGRVENRSVEGVVGLRLIDNSSASLDVNASISNVNNVIRDLGNSSIGLNSKLAPDRIAAGYPIGGVWRRPVLGYGDTNLDGFIDGSEFILGDTTVYMGWSLPKFQASYILSAAVLNRSLRLSVQTSYRGKHVRAMTYMDNFGAVSTQASLEDQAIAKLNSNAMDISEWRLGSGSISYDVPRSLTEKWNMKVLTISIQGSNLGLWTSYKGRDPMVNSTPIEARITDDGFTLPLPRKYSVSVRTTF